MQRARRFMMLLLKVITVVSLVGLAVSIQQPMYQNAHHGDLSFECHSGYGLSAVSSGFTGRYVKRNTDLGGDRLWMWECVKINFLKRDFCEWTGPINIAGEPMFFQCSPDAFMAGVRSTYNTSYDDRVWEVKCCRILNVCMQHCYLSHVLAEFGNYMPRYTARPDDHDGVFVGMYSAFDSGFDDREYRLAACQYDDCHISFKNPTDDHFDIRDDIIFTA